MPIPPEVLFHRYFQECPSPEERAHYWGKHDLSGAELTDFQRLLLLLQMALNRALDQADSAENDHEICSAFHVDYIDSDVENAVAFRYEGYCFIGLTEPLMYKLWTVCGAVSEVGAAAFRPVIAVPFDVDGLRIVLFRVLLLFVVCHEYTHHIHGHIFDRETLPVFFDEIGNQTLENFHIQITELDADAYATFLVLSHLIEGDARDLAIPLLKFNDADPRDQDKMLLSCFVLAIGSFFFATPPIHVSTETSTDSRIRRRRRE